MRLLSASGGLIAQINIPNTGNGGQVTLPIGIDDVSTMEVVLANSGAVVDYCTYESGAVEECPATTCDVVVLYSDFEGSANGGYGVWTDGGNDCLHHNFWSPRAIDTYAVRIRDNSSTSRVTTTQKYDLSNFTSLTLDFTYYAQGVGYNEKFLFEISLDGGSSYTTIESWAKGPDFQNNVRYYETVEMMGPFSNEVKFRFRNDMSHNSDRVHLDNILIDGCTSNPIMSRGVSPSQVSITNEELSEEETDAPVADLKPLEQIAPISEGLEMDLKVYPNPVQGTLNVIGIDADIDFEIININGAIMLRGNTNDNINVNNLESGTYILRASDGRVARFIKI